jgi:hypothetical protein
MRSTAWAPLKGYPKRFADCDRRSRNILPAPVKI